MSKVKSVFFSNMYAQIVTLGIAILSVPLFLKFWDLKTYGVWIVLYSIPSYLIVADFGIGSVSTNKLVMNSENTEDNKINVIFNTGLTSIVLLSTILILLSCLTIGILYIMDVFSIDILLAGFFLTVLACLTLLVSSMDGVFRYNGLYANSVFVLNSIRLLEWLGAILMLCIKPTYTAISLTMVVVRVICTVGLITYLRKKYEAPKWSFSFFSKRELMSLLRPSLLFSLFSLSNAISIQGMNILVASTLGTASVAVFNSYRTISRSVTQALSVVNRSFWSEFSSNYGKNDMVKLRKNVQACTKANLFVGITSALLMLITGKYIIYYWTHGKVIYDQKLFLMFIFAVFLTSFWQTNWVLLMSTNRHEKLAILFFTVSLSTVLTAYLLVGFIGLLGAGIALILFEMFMIPIASKQAAKIW